MNESKADEREMTPEEIEAMEQMEDYFDDEDDDASLRDHFAGLALERILEANEDELTDPDDVREKAREWATGAYAIADAMIDAKYGIDEDFLAALDADDEDDEDENDDVELIAEKND
jgi:hypothetical protein